MIFNKTMSEEPSLFFYAKRDLYYEDELVLMKSESMVYLVDPERTFRSFCYEFAGASGLPFPLLRFTNAHSGRELNLGIKAPTEGCLVLVDWRFSSAREPRGSHFSLQSQMYELLLNPLASDITLRLDTAAPATSLATTTTATPLPVPIE